MPLKSPNMSDEQRVPEAPPTRARRRSERQAGNPPPTPATAWTPVRSTQPNLGARLSSIPAWDDHEITETSTMTSRTILSPPGNDSLISDPVPTIATPSRTLRRRPSQWMLQSIPSLIRIWPGYTPANPKHLTLRRTHALAGATPLAQPRPRTLLPKVPNMGGLCQAHRTMGGLPQLPHTQVRGMGGPRLPLLASEGSQRTVTVMGGHPWPPHARWFHGTLA